MHYKIVVKGTFEVLVRAVQRDYLSRTILISVFGQRTERLSASLHW